MKTKDLVEKSTKRFKVFLQGYLACIAAIKAKKTTVDLWGGSDLPLSTASIYSFDAQDAVIAMQEANLFDLSLVSKWIKRKEKLDCLFIRLKHELFSDSERKLILEKDFQRRLEELYDYVSVLPMNISEEGHGFGNLLSMRSSLEALRVALHHESGKDIYYEKINLIDQTLKQRANLSWLYPYNAQDQLLDLIPKKRWWWYRENYE